MDDPLALSPETMRATGYRMVDLLVERVAGVREWPALTRASPSEMRERLHGPAPEAGTGFDVLLATLDRVVRTLEPGEFFGELAALDWGADYGYPRLATVVAASDLRLAKLSAAALRELMHDVPAIDAAIRHAASERLAIS